MSRPPVEIDMDQLKAMMRFKPTAADCAAFFKCSVDTIERRIKEYTITPEIPEGLSFAEFRDQNMVRTRMNLVQTALKKADKGDNVMLIFCLKNLCGWRDKQVDESDVVINNVNGMSDDVLDAKINEKLKKTAGE
jgi:hypothetical protein